MIEVIVAEIQNQPQRHAEKWETQLEHEGFESWLYLSKNWPPGKVIITIERRPSQFTTNSEDENK